MHNDDSIPMFWYQLALIAALTFMILAIVGGAAS